MMDQVEQTVFLMKNVPRDEKDLISDFVEGALNVDVTHVEYSVLSEGTVLVVIDEKLDIDDIAYGLKKEEDLLDCKTGSLKVLDAGYCDDAVVIYNLDEDLLSIDFLQMYIESKFADGCEVVSDCHMIPNCEKTAVVTFARKDVLPQVLERKDQVPLSSVEDYHIQVNPFYCKFYSASKDNSAEEEAMRSQLPEKFDIDKEEHDVDNYRTDNYAGTVNSSLHFYPSSNESDEDFADAEEESISKEPVEEIVKVPKLKWRLLMNKFQAKFRDQIRYDEEEQNLHIICEDVDDAKHTIIEELRNVKKISFSVSEEQETILKRQKVKIILDGICNNGNENIVYDIAQCTLNLYGTGDIKERLEEIKTRLLTSCSIQVPSDVPYEKIRECNTLCKSYELISVMFDEDKSMFILTGVTEDVTYASDDVKKKLSDYDWKNCTFVLKGKDALYVNMHAKDQLELLLKDATNARECVQKEDISYSFKCRKINEKKIMEDLNAFKNNIRKANVSFGEFDEEELELININAVEDINFFKEFEIANTCCIVVERGDSVAIKPIAQQLTNEEHEDDLFSSGQNKVLTFGHCTIHISPNGNIIREKSDLLVCGLHNSLDMTKTRVSMAFNKTDSSLKDEIKTYDFSQNSVFVAKKSLPGTSCQGIAFIVLETWQHGVSNGKLLAAITEVLDTADSMGFKSVSIPPLGSGRALKYPDDLVAQAIANAIDSFVRAKHTGPNCLKLISLLAPDRQLFTEVIDALEEKATKGYTPKPSGIMKTIKKLFNPSKKKKNVKYVEEFTEMQSPAITITVVSAREGDLALKLKDEMKRNWLVVDYFRPGDAFCWPPSFMNDVTKAAKKLNVKAKKIEDNATKQFVSKIKGRANDVQKMKDELYQLVLRMNQEKKLLFSPDAPTRGTMKFIEHAIRCDNHFPSYWKLKWEDFEDNSGNQQKSLFQDVDQATLKAIERVLLQTWDQSKVGNGYDAANIPHQSQVKVISVQRLENPTLFSNYLGKRLNILREMRQRARLCGDLGQLQNSKGPSQIVKHLDNNMKQELLHEINEQYMFHGTKENVVDQIREQGLDSRLTSPNAMFGLGVYFAESSTKSDQYADDRDKRLPNGSNLFMFLSRVALGDVFLCDDKHESVQRRDSRKLKRPPCLSCLKDICPETCPTKGQQRYHSVMGDGKWIFREFVVYSSDQCYPEYLIKYKRV